MLYPAYPIRTERLSLRPYVAGDFAAALTYWGRPDVTRYLYLDAFTPESFGERLEQLAARTTLDREGDVLTLAVVPAGSDQVIGDMTLFWHSEEHGHGEIGFIFHPDHQGHGYATEASEALLRMAFEDLGLHRVTGRLDARNEASARVLTKLGLRREAHFVANEWVKGEWTDEVVFAVLREEWLAARST